VSCTACSACIRAASRAYSMRLHSQLPHWLTMGPAAAQP
jgi:hypothetical protein